MMKYLPSPTDLTNTVPQELPSPDLDKGQCLCCPPFELQEAPAIKESELNRTVLEHMLKLPGLTLDTIKQVRIK